MNTKIETQPRTIFQLKGNLFTLTVMRLLDHDLTLFDAQLQETVKKAPKFFQNTPVVVDLSALAGKTIDFAALHKTLKMHHFVPVGVCKGEPLQHEHAAKAGFGVFPDSKELKPTATKESTKPVKKATTSLISGETPAHTPAQKSSNAATRLVLQSVRSGQQVYAKDGDLIVLGAVSHGAELLADGHIHVYGTLRGRALAGVNGNRDARIFCQSLEAEMVSIGGYYLLNDEKNTLLSKKNVHIFLEKEELVVEDLV